jgi:hypothetical protein
VVGVLVLVDEHVPKAAPVVLGDVREGLQHVDRRHDQVVEVEGVGLPQPLLVHAVGVGQGAVGVARIGGRRLLGVRLLVDQLVLQVRHLDAERARRVALGVEVELAADQRHQPLRVGRVIDGERRLQPDPGGLAAQDAHAGRVEGGDPHDGGPASDQRRDPLAHLAGCLVGERDGEHLSGPHPTGCEQVGDAVHQHPGLA